MASRLPPMMAPFQTRQLSTSIGVHHPDPSLLAKFKCNPTIPCDIPTDNVHLNALWYHISDDLLPTNWSSDWLEFARSYWCLPYMSYTYSMGGLDMALKANYEIRYPIKGVMYCTVEWKEPGGLFKEKLPPGNQECLVFQDALGEYYFYYEFSQGGDGELSKFRAPHGTTVSDFLKHHFRGGVKGVDMDPVSPEHDFGTPHETLYHEQKELVRLWDQAKAQSRCACLRKGPVAKLKLANLRLLE